MLRLKTLLVLALMIPGLPNLFFTRSSGSNPRPEGAVVSYEYSYSNTMMYPVTFYRVDRDSTGTVRISWSKDNEPDITVIRGPEDLLEKIGAIAAAHKLHRLKNSYWPRMEILDGHGWHMYLRYAKNSTSSGGSNAWPPEKLLNGISSINGCLRGLIDASTEADVIGHDSHADRH